MTRVHAPTTPSVHPHSPTEPPPPPPQRPGAAPAGQPSAAHRGLVERAAQGRGGAAAAQERAAAARKALAPYAAVPTTVSRDAVAQAFADPRHAHLTPQAVGGHASAAFVRQVLAQDPGLADACLDVRMRGGTTEVDRAIARQAGAGLTGIARYMAGESALAKLRQFGPESRKHILHSMNRGAPLSAAVSAEGKRILEQQQAAARQQTPAEAARSAQLTRLAEVRQAREAIMARAATLMQGVRYVDRATEFGVGVANLASFTGNVVYDVTRALPGPVAMEALSKGRGPTLADVAAPLAELEAGTSRHLGYTLTGPISGAVAKVEARFRECAAVAKRLELAEAALDRAIREGRTGDVTTGTATVRGLQRELTGAVGQLEDQVRVTRGLIAEFNVDEAGGVIGSVIAALKLSPAAGVFATHLERKLSEDLAGAKAAPR